MPLRINRTLFSFSEQLCAFYFCDLAKAPLFNQSLSFILTAFSRVSKCLFVNTLLLTIY